MGIESDQLVYDYLSKVGDLAQRQSLTSGDRMRLVSRLRAEIERRRAAEGADSPTAVQRILDGLGTPAEAVAVAGTGGGAGGGAEGAGRVPVQRQYGEAAAARRVPGAALPPHLATEEELRPVSGVHPDGWGLEPGPFRGGDEVHGFVGGIEIPDMLKPPEAAEPREARRGTEAGAPEGAKASEKPEKPETPGKPGKRRAAPEPEEDEEEPPDRRFRFWYSRAGVPMSPLLLLVALLLVTGAVLGNWLVIVAGWALAYVTRRLTQTESKLAVMGVPGLVVAGGLVWLWGRMNGRWGAPIAEGEMGTALSETLPVVVKVAAVASAAFVLWRARRPG
ncbi:hypothetical protein [Streptomyces cinnamoneus]|uniref:Membrane protein n=1 Tax=Streptomyces cinnamoneus TaxID=53446 RepID=A0A918WQZ4_STRCJ|nr:hypothetical protein [Streptomyces cinnamoneus]GHC71509.1 membrane protein [Streptomyces cinnamoneus]